MKKAALIVGGFILFALLISGLLVRLTSAQIESGSVGIEGRISSPPPSVGATISSPATGARFTSIPIVVSGICPNGLLVKIFKNDVFSGSVQCDTGSFSMPIDLFSGQNNLVARVYDNLDQPGPDSNTVTVFYDDGSGTNGANRITLTSNFAKKGANPGDDLTWPIVVSGGQGPYAVSAEWGDGQTSLQSVLVAGEFTVRHAYKNSGIYKLIIKAVDQNGITAYIQLVAIANGDAGQDTEQTSADDDKTRYIVLWQPMLILITFVITTFWLGKKYELRRIKKAIEEGKRPF